MPRRTLQVRNALIGVVIALCAVPTPTTAQVSAPSAGLLRRLAEAVDGQRDNRLVWVVIQRQFPYSVQGLYHSQADAAAAATGVTGYLTLGPYQTPPDSGTHTMMMTIDPCPGRHDSYSHCPDTTHSNSTIVATMAVQDVDSMVVTIYGRQGAPIHRVFGGDEVDALFFTMSAIDKFVIPYYTRLYGPAMAASMRSEYLRRVSQATH